MCWNLKKYMMTEGLEFVFIEYDPFLFLCKKSAP